jgi:2-polyprenyl-3-methyl-5-hydroxy-6-metoxy-1,4-benzoquinol methylase
LTRVGEHADTPTTAVEQRASKAPPCSHCQSPLVTSILCFREQESFRCQNCGGLFNDPGHETSQMCNEAYYQTVYIHRKDAQLKYSRRYMRVIKCFQTKGSVLDYGCGTGIFLVAAAEAGFTANVGADTSRDGLRLAKQNVNASVTLIHLPSERLPDRKFEVISFMDTISAIPEAYITMSKLVDRHLSEEGVLAIRTPNITHSYFLTVKVLSWFLGKKYASKLMFADSRHTLFDVATLERFLKAIGFEVVFLECRRDYFVPIAKVKRLRGYCWRFLRWVLRRRSIFVVARARLHADSASRDSRKQT